jgi:transposase
VSVSSVHLAQPRPATAPHPAVQVVERSAVRRQGTRHRGLYLDPPAHAVVLSVDEKSQIQALDRTQPGLPLKKGRCGTMTHDYKRNGTTTLFAALNVLEGGVIGRCMQRHRHQEFIRFLNTIGADVPKVLKWLARHPRFIFHFTPTSASWINAAEGFFAELTKQRLKRVCFTPSSPCRRPSIASSSRPTPTRAPSDGPMTPTKSSPPSDAGTMR